MKDPPNTTVCCTFFHNIMFPAPAAADANVDCDCFGVAPCLLAIPDDDDDVTAG